LWAALGAAALVTMIDVPAHADDDLVLPWGIYRSETGRYFQDACDHGFARPCLVKHILPPDYVPVLVPRSARKPHPLAGGYCASMGAFGGSSPMANTMAPADVLAAYSVPASSHGYGKIVALVDMPDAHIFADVNTYRAAYNIPALPQCATGFPDGKTPCFAQVDELGKTPNYTTDDCPGADTETALDAEMVSAACPDCSIVVVQMTVAFQNGGPQDGDFLQGAQTAATLGAVATSISFGGEEYPGEPTGYTTPGHLVFAASGDSGYLDGYGQGGGGTPEYPASAPDVLGVGGTTLVPLGGGTYAEKVWNEPAPAGYQSVGGGGGCSTTFEPPAFQTAFLTTHPGAFGNCQNRDSVDLAAAAEFIEGNNGGISVYDSASGGWSADLGTSAASPMVAAIFTRVGIAEATSNDMGFPYTNIAAFNKVVASSNSTPAQGCTSDPVQCNADGGTGWNGPTGVGTPNGTMLAPLGTPNMSSSSSGGADAGPEGGTTHDAGSGSGSGGAADSGSGSGSGGSEDAGSGSSGSSSKSGCSCDSVGTAQSGLGGLGLLAMGAGALVVARRRRSRS
jgi:hypothetical protein